MNEFGQQINFKQLLDRHGRIQVPMIQRDYAQGRESEAEVRDEFLDALHRALILDADDDALPLNLDFIYGSVEDEGKTRFLPLDGQQRLTTLFLLHWYIAWADSCWESFRELLLADGHSRFSYGVRPSSTEFFNALVKFQPDESPDSLESVSRLVTNQPWYFRYWRLDSTIQSSLRMLDAIHQRFRDSSGLYERIIDTEQPAITFQLLDLENFGLSDDLYIKMNARGKPLTAFETFKARYEQELESQFEGESRSIGNKSFSVAEFFSRRMDTAWADFFWVYRSTETNLFDAAVMNLFRAIVLATRDPESDSYVDDISLLRDRSVKSSYAVFHNKGWLDRNFSDVLILLLETWSKKGTDFATQLPDANYFDEVSIFKAAVSGPTDLGYVDIVRFIGYVVYLREQSDSPDAGAFQEWMRIVFNLAVNTAYDRPADLQRSVSGLLSMAPHSGDILRFFAATDRPTAGFSPQQVSEEKLKAELILADPDWRPLIDRAEGHGYLRGQIEFLLHFCGALDKWKAADDVNWGHTAHTSLQERFETYLGKAEVMFTARGIADLGRYRWERALLSIGDYLLPSGGQNVSFLVNSATEQASWKRLLRGTGPKVAEARILLQQLLDRFTANDTLSAQLDEIIDGATGLEPWRQAFVQTPKAIAYCKRRSIRWYSEGTVYLLRKTQMNGAHAELITYCLFHNQLLPMAADAGFDPLTLDDEYYSSTESGVEPGIRFHWSRNEHSLIFEVEWIGKVFIIYVGCGSVEDLPDVKSTLCQTTGFTETETRLVRETSSTNFFDVLLELRQALTATSNADQKNG